MSISSVYPATGETLKTFEPYDEAEVERRLALADSAFRVYRRTRFDERATLVRAMADALDRLSPQALAEDAAAENSGGQGESGVRSDPAPVPGTEER